MKAVIFTGPSLSHEEAKEIFDEAEYRAPIRRGDAIKALKEGIRVLGIIDGVFHQDVAISPREILEVMREGAIVVGGSSIGALRAAELCDLGMIGVGEIFRMFRSGELDSDDEVAVLINPETLEAISEPLVNIRATISALVKKGVIETELGNELIRLAKRMHYSKRSYENLLEEAVESHLLSSGDAEKLLKMMRENAVNLKKLDAIKVVETVKEICSAEKF